ncbi:MAG TPA: 30S ribosomal protein S3, partial [Patescibacteria group bacterium]|nr:30S ribosomal protein S3 [Patescibacteria group bacterium]
MGQKVNPHLIRLQVINTWTSRWFDDKNYKQTVLEDYNLRTMLLARLERAGIARVEIERSIKSIKVILYVAKPGMVIGRAGSGIEDLKNTINAFLQKNHGKQAPRLELQVEPVKEPNLDPFLVAKNVADQLIRRLPYKRVLVTTADKVLNSGARGVRIVLAGRIAGAEIHRTEKIQIGTVPLSTIRANIQ